MKNKEMQLDKFYKLILITVLIKVNCCALFFGNWHLPHILQPFLFICFLEEMARIYFWTFCYLNTICDVPVGLKIHRIKRKSRNILIFF